MGPGTHIIDNVMKGVQPRSNIDAFSLVHDINYLIATADSEKLAQADRLAISRAYYEPLSAQRSIFIAGLELRKFFGLKDSENQSQKELYNAWGNKLRDYVLTSPNYAELREVYGITDSDFV